MKLFASAHLPHNADLLGRNYALLGLSKEKMLKCFGAEDTRYGPMVAGYDDATLNPDAERIDFNFSCQELATVLVERLYSTRILIPCGTLLLESTESFFVHGVGQTAYVVVKEAELALAFVVEISQTIYTDGSGGDTNYSIEVHYTPNSQTMENVYDSELWRNIARTATNITGVAVRACGYSSLSDVAVRHHFDTGAKTVADIFAVVATLPGLYSKQARLGKLEKKPFVNVSYVHTDFFDDGFWDSFNTTQIFQEN